MGEEVGEEVGVEGVKPLAVVVEVLVLVQFEQPSLVASQ